MLSVALFVFVGWIVTVCLHEFGHAVVAYWGGDTSVKDKGYLTLNPLRYTDVNLSLVLPLIFLLLGGIPLPGAAVYIETHRLRHRAWKSAVSFAGPASTALCAIALAVPFWLNLAPPADMALLNLSGGGWLWFALAFLVQLEVAGVVLNLLPFPGLDGYGILEPWLPAPMRQRFKRWGNYGFIALFALLWMVPVANQAFWSLVYQFSDRLGVSRDMVGQGYFLFNRYAAGLLVAMLVIVVLAQKANPQSFTVLKQTGDRQMQQGEYQQAIATYDQLLQKRPDYTPAWINRGNGLAQLQQYDAAMNSYEQALKRSPDDAYVIWLQALVLTALEQYGAALEACDRALFLQSDLVEAWQTRGQLLQRLKQPLRAIAAYDQALQLQPRDPAITLAKSLVHMELAQYEEAMACYQTILAQNPKHDLALYNLGCCYAVQGDEAEAIAYLKRAIALQPAVYRELMATDPDWDLLRASDAFQALSQPQ